MKLIFLFLSCSYANLTDAACILQAGLEVEDLKAKTAVENIVNADTVSRSQNVYQKKIIINQSRSLPQGFCPISHIATDQSPAKKETKNGIEIYAPNIDKHIEMIEYQEALMSKNALLKLCELNTHMIHSAYRIIG